jgi:hypothetical protein
MNVFLFYLTSSLPSSCLDCPWAPQKLDIYSMSFGFGVGDIFTVSQFAIQLYDSCSNAPGQFAELRDQAKSLSEGLGALETRLASRPTVAQHANVLRVVAGFKPILSELNTLIAKRRRLESKGFQLWERLRWPGNQKLTELRSRLDYQLSLLRFHLDVLARYHRELRFEDVLLITVTTVQISAQTRRCSKTRSIVLVASLSQHICRSR